MSLSRPSILCVCVSLCSLLAVGCWGGDTPELGDAYGVVTLDGEPVIDAKITFMPVDAGRASSARTDESGEYRMIYSLREYGARVGNHRVHISTAKTDELGKMVGETIPVFYRDGPGVPEVTVEGGWNEFNFELTTDH
ncbi:carboxypeptidase-like regulatory domain-containing protein [Calycomorphotria hydatis]|uniref:Carboxypeptidase regulatory-like domain-containing protein n=1 Tax=Calycomorphotria hydatis TaxID=2528027 RepID=A0A517T4M9_9PLAN|nr:carboxypeptidase-like regulatory domain-containing protein [Calycomorphotria hydatis]QDT63314.1 hypothetical protein V22_05340 [Calycomorphotria hydatis]